MGIFIVAGLFADMFCFLIVWKLSWLFDYAKKFGFLKVLSGVFFLQTIFFFTGLADFFSHSTLVGVS